jgi:hypothetical protein
MGERVSLETHAAVFVDTSYSMTEKISVTNTSNDRRGVRDFLFAGTGNKLRKKEEIGEEIWQSIVDHICPMPLTVRTITEKHGSTTLQEIGTYSPATLRKNRFAADGGGTYLWEFLVNQGKELIQKSGRWMFILISDGMDNESTSPYDGIDGFRACVDALQAMNIDTEFHIIGLGLPTEACEVFRQISGSTGGVFYNLGSGADDEKMVKEVVENLTIAIEEAVDPALRARSRRRRQAEYLEGCSDGDLTIIEIPSAVPDLEFDSEGVYARLGIEELNPDSMEKWEESFLSVAGHTEVRTTETSEHWTSSVSHSNDPRLSKTMRGTWTLDASQLSQIARSNVNALFDLTNQIKYSPIPAEFRSIVVRGSCVSKGVKDIVRGAGARIIILPADLPAPPIGWDKTILFLEAGEVPFADSGWSMMPTAFYKPSKVAVIYDMFDHVQCENLSDVLGLKDAKNWSSPLGEIPGDYLNYFNKKSWEGLGLIDDEVLESISVQFNSIVKYICTNLSVKTEFFAIRPNENIMEILENHQKLQMELLTRIDDFLILHSKKNHSKAISVDYWPTLSQ